MLLPVFGNICPCVARYAELFHGNHHLLYYSTNTIVVQDGLQTVHNITSNTSCVIFEHYMCYPCNVQISFILTIKCPTIYIAIATGR